MHSILIIITLNRNSDCELQPDDARRCLDYPACVLVENAESDGAFLMAMIHAFKRRELLNAHTEGWWRVEHLGGRGEVAKRIDQICALAFGLKRLLLLVDSDRLYPDHVTHTIRMVESCCTHRKVPYAILRKREIENYLPVDVLRKVAKRNKRIYQAFLGLNEQQKDHYDMKKGFKAGRKGQAIVREEQKNLFQHVPERILNDLCGGFGDEIWKSFATHRKLITDEAVKITCSAHPSEICGILDSIERLL